METVETIHRPEPEQRELLAQLAGDDVVIADNAFTVIYNDYAPYLVSKAQYWLRNAPNIGCTVTAKDIVHNVMMKIWERRQQLPLHNVHYIWKYLETAVRRLCLNAIRDAANNPSIATDSEDSVWKQPTSAPSPSETAEASELRNIIGKALKRLPQADRALFVDKHIKGHTYNEVGPRYGYTPGRAKSKLHEIRKRLQRYILASYSH